MTESPAFDVAWQAYLQMFESKHRYFTFLQSLEEKYDSGGSPDSEETQKLTALLDVHDDSVTHFNQAMGSVVEPAERSRLLDKMRQHFQ